MSTETNVYTIDSAGDSLTFVFSSVPIVGKHLIPPYYMEENNTINIDFTSCVVVVVVVVVVACIEIRRIFKTC